MTNLRFSNFTHILISTHMKRYLFKRKKATFSVISVCLSFALFSHSSYGTKKVSSITVSCFLHRIIQSTFISFFQQRVFHTSSLCFKWNKCVSDVTEKGSRLLYPQRFTVKRNKPFHSILLSSFYIIHKYKPVKHLTRVL